MSKVVKIRDETYEMIGLLAIQLQRKQIDIVDLAVFLLATKFNLPEMMTFKGFQARVKEGQILLDAMKKEKGEV